MSYQRKKSLTGSISPPRSNYIIQLIQSFQQIRESFFSALQKGLVIFSYISISVVILFNSNGCYDKTMYPASQQMLETENQFPRPIKKNRAGHPLYSIYGNRLPCPHPVYFRKSSVKTMSA